LDTEIISIDGVEIPAQLNWRDYNVLAPIKDQIRCNACYAFAALGAIEANHKIKTGQDINLSEQEIVDCSSENEGCVGGLPQLVYEYVYDNDISYTANYPYDQSKEGICRKNSVQYNGRNLKSYTNLGKGILNLIKALSKGPVAVISYASFSFKHYGGGIYKGQGCHQKEEPNHASLLVGYNLVGRKKWLYFKNGWGMDWGERGFYKVQLTSLQSKNQGHCLVAGTTYNSIPLIK
jgi:C1A family cysteine protease